MSRHPDVRKSLTSGFHDFSCRRPCLPNDSLAEIGEILFVNQQNNNRSVSSVYVTTAFLGTELQTFKARFLIYTHSFEKPHGSTCMLRNCSSLRLRIRLGKERFPGCGASGDHYGVTERSNFRPSCGQLSTKQGLLGSPHLLKAVQ